MSTLTQDTKVGQIATEYPLATRVFARHGIDFCCGGGIPLEEACAKRGVDVKQLLAEIAKELEKPDTERRWDQAPLGELCDFILTTYHRSLKEELPRIEAMARRVHTVHGDKDPQRFKGIVDVFMELKNELDSHMMKEEQVLFPMIKAGHGQNAQGPVNVMLHEHDIAANCLRRLNELTDGYTVPAEACNTWRALWHGLAALEADLHHHIHLENNILFPRALGEDITAN